MIETTPILSHVLTTDATPLSYALTTDPATICPEIETGLIGSEGLISGSEGVIQTSED